MCALPLFRWSLTAQLRSRCLGVFSCPRLSCFLLQWPALFGTAGVTPGIWMSSFTYYNLWCALHAAAPPHAFHSHPTFCVIVRLAQLLPSVRFGFVSYSVLLLHCAPTLPLVLRSRTTAIHSTHYRVALGLSLICTPMLPPVHLAVRFRRRRYAFTDSAQLSRNVRSMQHLHFS